MRISDWSSDVCSSDLFLPVSRRRNFHNRHGRTIVGRRYCRTFWSEARQACLAKNIAARRGHRADAHISVRSGVCHWIYRLKRLYIAYSIEEGDKCRRSEEHTSELQSLMRISYAVFCLKKKKTKNACQNME